MSMWAISRTRYLRNFSIYEYNHYSNRIPIFFIQVAWQDLKDHFKAAGNVTRADVMTGSDGRSKGCGIVEFSRCYFIFFSTQFTAI